MGSSSVVFCCCENQKSIPPLLVVREADTFLQKRACAHSAQLDAHFVCLLLLLVCER